MYEMLFSSSNFIVLFVLLIIPEVTVLLNSNPIGFPIAYTFSPTLILSESPKLTVFVTFAFIFIIAKSKSESAQITSAVYSFPVSNVTWHLLYLFPTTC